MMLSLFCLRLALGLLASLLPLWGLDVHPRFFRTQFLTALGLLTLAWAVSLAYGVPADGSAWYVLTGSLVVCGLGSVAWALGGRGGSLFTLLGTLGTGWALFLLSGEREADLWLARADDLTSAAVLGSATTAMLLGHSYLISPAMSIAPLYRAVAALGVSLLARVAVSLYALWLWRALPSATLSTETALWLAVRWCLGFLLPLVLTWMSYETARIRSTQSATGILYVAVIFCFLGELTGLLLFAQTGLAL